MSKRITASGLLVALLVGAQVWLAVGQSERVGLTSDESVHIVSGLYYNLESDYRFQPENGLLPQRLEALPWVWAGVEVPARTGLAWERADIWALGEKLFMNAGAHGAVLLKMSRLVSVLAGAGLLLLIYFWSRSIYGRVGALLATALAAFCPNLLAQAGLATSDTLGTLMLIAAALAWWRLCHRVTLARVAVAGVLAGLLALSKFSCVLLGPIALLLVGVRLIRRAALPWQTGVRVGRWRGANRVWWLLGAGLSVALVAVVVIWAGYGFRYRAATDAGGEFMKSWDVILMREAQPIGLPQLGESPDAQVRLVLAGALQHAIGFARDHRLLPEAWLYGFGFVAYHSHYRLAYFAGDYGTAGWWNYFPTALALKTPLAGMLVCLLGLVVWARMRERKALAYRAAPWLVLAVVVLAFGIVGSINIGLRHVLPAVAVFWVLAGATCAKGRWGAPRGSALLAGGCVVVQAWTAWTVAPHSLAYFNPLAGARPDRWFVDSNLDWGQGLPELARWHAEQPEQPLVFLAYFGSDMPARYGLKVVRFADHHFDRAPRQLPAPLTGGWYAFGATMYRRAYSQTRGPWTAAREALYQDMLLKIGHNDLPTDAAAREVLLLDYDCLRLARLTHFLEGRTAEATLAGGAMLLFKLSEEEVTTALYAPLRVVNEAVIRRLEGVASSATPSP